MSLLIKQLQRRLSELQWQLETTRCLNHELKIPYGLFRCGRYAIADQYIQEIHTDLLALEQSLSSIAEQYIAEQVNSKVSVLVALCVQHKALSVHKPCDGVWLDALMSRNQHIQAIEKRIAQLKEQQAAMQQALGPAQRLNTEQKLSCQSELGEVMRQLTLLQEQL